MYAKVTNSEVPITPEECPVPSAIISPTLHPSWSEPLGGWVVRVPANIGALVDMVLVSGMEAHVHGARYERVGDETGVSWVYDVELVLP